MLAADASDALITGGATLLGVVVGAVLGGAIDLWLTRQRQKSGARAAARLVLVDMSASFGLLRELSQDDWLRTAFQQGKLESLFQAFTVPSWQSQRELLSQTLTDEQWQNVARAVMQVELMGTLHRVASDPTAQAPVKIDGDMLDTSIRQVVQAVRELAPIAGVELDAEDEAAIDAALARG